MDKPRRLNIFPSLTFQIVEITIFFFFDDYKASVTREAQHIFVRTVINFMFFLHLVTSSNKTPLVIIVKTTHLNHTEKPQSKQHRLKCNFNAAFIAPSETGETKVSKL